MGDRFVSCELDEILVGEPLPVSVYLYLNFRFITYRAAGDVIDRTTYDRLDFKKVRNLFVNAADEASLRTWAAGRKREEAARPPLSPENQAFSKTRADVHRKLHDIFLSEHPEKIVAQSLEASKTLVTEVMKFPYAVSTLSQLQGYSRGTIDHSMNVSILSVYLAMQMGYSHQLILQHVGAGGLLHDIGKPRVALDESDNDEAVRAKMLDHPALGLALIEQEPRVPNEVKMIIAQHHEFHDGSGYPKKLRGAQIYDLARIVAIANEFDGLVADSSGSLVERQRAAIQKLDQVFYKRFDPQKLDKVLKILRLGV